MRLNILIQTYNVDGFSILLPRNKTQYTANEACHILMQVQDDKAISLIKSIANMLSYKVTPFSDVTPLIPCNHATMFHVFNKVQEDKELE